MKLEISNPNKINELNSKIWFDTKTDAVYVFKHIETGIVSFVSLTRNSVPTGGKYTLYCGMKGMVISLDEIKDLNKFVKNLIYMVEWNHKG